LWIIPSPSNGWYLTIAGCSGFSVLRRYAVQVAGQLALDVQVRRVVLDVLRPPGPESVGME
jgi:hypothetical protein